MFLMINSFLHKIYVDQYVTKNISKSLCYTNNIRARFICILFLFIALLSSVFDFLIFKHTVIHQLFILHFKTDIIFLICTILFLLYIFYNQVKKVKEITKYHRIIHGAISLIIILWGTIKSSLTILTNDVNYYIYFITVLITAVIFYFPFIMYLSQVIFSYILLWLTHILLNISFNDFLYNLGFMFILLMIAFIISRTLYYYKVKSLLKEREITKLKQHINYKRKEKPES